MCQCYDNVITAVARVLPIALMTTTPPPPRSLPSLPILFPRLIGIVCSSPPPRAPPPPAYSASPTSASLVVACPSPIPPSLPPPVSLPRPLPSPLLLYLRWSIPPLPLPAFPPSPLASPPTLPGSCSPAPPPFLSLSGLYPPSPEYDMEQYVALNGIGKTIHILGDRW